jgi:hypothetical protein
VFHAGDPYYVNKLRLNFSDPLNEKSRDLVQIYYQLPKAAS